MFVRDNKHGELVLYHAKEFGFKLSELVQLKTVICIEIKVRSWYHTKSITCFVSAIFRINFTCYLGVTMQS